MTNYDLERLNCDILLVTGPDRKNTGELGSQITQTCSLTNISGICWRESLIAYVCSILAFIQVNDFDMYEYFPAVHVWFPPLNVSQNHDVGTFATQ